MTVSVAEKMTVREFLDLPPARGAQLRELIDGEVVVTDPALRHQVASARLIAAIFNWTEAGRQRGLVSSPIDVRIDEHSVYKPDVVWYSQARIPAEPDRRPQAVPDLAVEIRSPSTWRYDIGAKKAGYDRAGLRELWLVDTAAAVVLVFRRSTPDARGFDVALELARGDALTSPLLPSFALAVDQVFAT